jgi:hypothetical protein
MKKTFNYVEITLGIVEAEDLEDAMAVVEHGFGPNIGHTTYEVFNPDDDPKFWGNLEIDTVKELKSKIEKL